MCGASATYTETIDTSGSTALRNVVTTGCPNHYAVCTGKEGTTGCGGYGEEGTGTQATPQDHDFNIPLYPIIATSTTDWPECARGRVRCRGARERVLDARRGGPRF